MATGGGGGGGRGGVKEGASKTSSTDREGGGAARNPDEESNEVKGASEKFRFTGQVLAAVVVTAVAGNIVAARRFRKTMTETVARNAQRRKEEAERAARAARNRQAAGGEAGGPLDGHPLRDRIPKEWQFDDSREAAFAERRLNSHVVQHLSTLGVKNFVAGREEVKAAYRGKAMSLHPDRNFSKGSEGEFKKVAASYTWLDNNYFRKGDP